MKIHLFIPKGLQTTLCIIITYESIPARGSLKEFFAVEQKGDRPIIDQFHCHPGLKFTRGNGNIVLLEIGNKALIEFLCLLGFGGIGKGWPASFAAVAEEGELRDHQYLTPDIKQREIESFLVILEDPQLGDLGSQVVRVLLLVLLSHSEEDEQSPLDLAHDVVLDGDPGLPYPLDDGAYGFYPSSCSCWVSAMIRSQILAGTSS